MPYDNVSGQGSICRQWDFHHESCYPQQVWVEGIIFSQKEKNAAEVMIFPLPQIFFLAIKWPWLVKLLADNMLNIVLKRKREFLDFFRFFSKNSNFWKKFKYVIWSIVYIPVKLIPLQSKWAWFHSSYTKFKVHYGCFLQLPRNWIQIWQSVIWAKSCRTGKKCSACH